MGSEIVSIIMGVGTVCCHRFMFWLQLITFVYMYYNRKPKQTPALLYKLERSLNSYLTVIANCSFVLTHYLEKI